jgi:predicted nucleic acid-binding protein
MDYIDSCVIIAAYFPTDPNHKEAEKLMKNIKKFFIRRCCKVY